MVAGIAVVVIIAPSSFADGRRHPGITSGSRCCCSSRVRSACWCAATLSCCSCASSSCSTPSTSRSSLSRACTDNVEGHVIVLFVMIVAAAEVAVGLAIIVSIFRRRHSANVDDLSMLQG